MGFGTLVQRIVYKISGRPLASSGLYVPSTYMYDYAIGGVPFLSATSDTRPDLEKPVQQRKDQFDANKDPGEYSLNQWWLRSQTSFTGGTGVIYQDPDTQGQSRNTRFSHSVGVDPFSDPDILQLLHDAVDTGAVNSDTRTAATFLAAFDGGDNNNLWIAHGATVYSYRVNSGSLTLGGSVTIPSSDAFQTITQGIVEISDLTGTSPTNYSFVNMSDSGTAANNGIWRIDDGGPPIASRRYVVPNTSFPAQSLGKARGLLAYSRAEKLYMLDPYAAANTALPTANAAVPKDQNIVAVTDGPDAVYVAANSGTQGYIYKTTFDSSGIVNGLTLTAVLPNGEKINSISAYVNTYLVITTVFGVRVGTFTGSGVQYGPNIIPVMSTAGMQGFGEIAFNGSFAFIATLDPAQHDGSKGLMCIDLSSINQDQNTGAVTNAYSTWVYFSGNTIPITDVTVTTDGRTVHATGFNGLDKVFLEHSTNLISTGYLDTGRCRFNTVEPKLFKYFSIRTPTPLNGDISVALLDDQGGVTSYITYGPTLDPGTDDIATPTPSGPRNWEALRFTLKRNPSTLSIGAELDSWQIKALPGTLKQRNITRQFLCFNSEKDKSGQVISSDTGALDRLTAVRQMCQRGDTVTLQDLVNNISDQVIIDDYQFTMLASPGPNGENYGGYLTLVMRTVADSVPPISLAGSVDEE